VNRLGGPGSRTVVGSVLVTAVAGVVALTFAACSGDDKPTPKNSSGSTSASSSSGAPSGSLKDESAAVLGGTPRSPAAKTEGKVEAVSKGQMVPATAEIISVQASEASTILTWQLSSATDIPLQGFSLNAIHGARSFPDLVHLIDPVGKKSYAVNTMVTRDTTYCVCSAYPIHVGPDPVQMTAEYPALPATATSVSVRIPNFAPVTVPVTR
jgi:hypothetical protein